MAAATPPIDIVIVNYRTGPLVLSCLESLEAERQAGERLRVYVVDNDSCDGSADLIAAALAQHSWDWVTLIRSPANGGFGAGNNIGIAQALEQSEQSEFVWLLNPDTRVLPGAARALASFMENFPLAGIAGTLLLEADGTPWPYAFRFPTILGEVERGLRWGPASRVLSKHATLRPMGHCSEQVDWVSGASFAIRNRLLQEGLRFDEAFFLYYEETDFCREAYRRGWETWFVPQACVLHIAGQSTGVTGKDAELRRVPAYWFQSRQYYFRKSHGRNYAMVADLAWLTAHLLFLAKDLVGGARSIDPPRLLQDFLRHCTLPPIRR